MTPSGLRRKILFRVCLILSGRTMKNFAQSLCPPVSSVAINSILEEKSQSKRINNAVSDFVNTISLKSGLVLKMAQINLNLPIHHHAIKKSINKIHSKFSKEK